MRTRRGLLVLFGASLLGGCGGWALRGSRRNVLGDVTRVMVRAPTYGPLYAYFAAELSYINISLVTSAPAAHAIIEFTNERFERRVLSVEPDTGKVREIEVTLSMDMTVRAGDGSLIAAPQAFRWTEDFVFDEGSLLGTVENETVLRQEMAKVAARALVLKLETIDFRRQGKPASQRAAQT